MHQLDESKELFNSELDGLREQSSHKIKDAENYISGEFQQFVDDAEHKVSEFEGRIQDSVDSYEKRSKEIVERTGSYSECRFLKENAGAYRTNSGCCRKEQK